MKKKFEILFDIFSLLIGTSFGQIIVDLGQSEWSAKSQSQNLKVRLFNFLLNHGFKSPPLVFL